MADISMCLDNNCPSRFTCYRHSASGTWFDPLWQSVMDFKRDPKKDKCDSYEFAVRTLEKKS